MLNMFNVVLILSSLSYELEIIKEETDGRCFIEARQKVYDKKIVILQTSGNELANQLWNYASIYAYTLERGYTLENPSFFEYGNYFTMPAPNPLFKAAFFNPFTNYTARKSAPRRKIWRKLYFWYARTVLWFFGEHSIAYKDPDNKPYYLPPTTKKSPGRLGELEKKKGIFILTVGSLGIP